MSQAPIKQGEIRRRVSLARDLLDRGEEEQAAALLAPIEAYATQNKGSTFPDVLNMLGLIAFSRGDNDKSKNYLQAALDANPNYTEAALNLAIVLNELGQYEAAKATYRKIEASKNTKGEKTIEPFARGRIANLHAETAQAYADLSLFKEAKLELRKAVVLCPTFSDLRLRLANILRQEGDLEGARYELVTAIEHRPTFVPARIALGVVELSLDHKEEAKSAWQKALELEPNNKVAKSYLKMAESLDQGMRFDSQPPKKAQPPKKD